MTQPHLNGIDLSRLNELRTSVADNANRGKVTFSVTTEWAGGTRSDTRVRSWQLGEQTLQKDFTITIDEPVELLGDNQAANPQEMLMAAFNACMLVGYVAGSSVAGIELSSIAIETRGTLDLRGFLGIDATVTPGYDEIDYTVRIKGNGTREQFEDVHRMVMATSPNRWNVANPIRLSSALVIEDE